MDFEKKKLIFLLKKDKSTKGSIDNDIKYLLEKINSLNDYFTTSSCSGRIVLLTTQEKKSSKFIFVSHQPCNLPKITQNCWLMVEPIILHVRCRNLNAANILLDLVLRAGLGKSGLISLDGLLLEINSTERIVNYLTPNLNQEYITELNEIANNKLKKMKEKIFVLIKSIEFSNQDSC
ncbi:hypothetical protein J4436_02855 [Candidatus Woesearchaeota archaeon]|nr:hypothetical protein [Candidatus Woesearchaeota archaeon]